MDRGAWQARIHGITRVGHDLATEHTCIYHLDIASQQPCSLHSSFTEATAEFEGRGVQVVGTITSASAFSPLMFSQTH